MSQSHNPQKAGGRQQSATLGGTRLWAPFPVRPFLSTYTTTELSRFVRTYVDEPFASKFAGFIEAVGMNGRAFVALEDDALARLCRNDLGGLFELQTWKTSLRKPTSPRIRDIFDLPPTSPTFSGSCSPSPPNSSLELDSTSPSELDTPEWALEENSLLSTPESSEFPFEDPTPWSPDAAGEGVDIVEVAFDNNSPVVSQCPIKHDGAPLWSKPPVFFQTVPAAPRLSRVSSTTSLRSIHILNFDESGTGGFSPINNHSRLQAAPMVEQPSSASPSRSPYARSDPARNVLDSSLQSRPPDSSHDPPENTNYTSDKSQDLSILHSFFYEDLPLDLLGQMPEITSSCLDASSSLLMQVAARAPQDHAEYGTPILQNTPGGSPSTASSSCSLSPDPWDAALALFDSDAEDHGDTSVSRGSDTYTPGIPAIIVGDAPLSDGMVIVEVDARLQKLLDDPRVELFVDGDDRVVVTPRDCHPARASNSSLTAIEDGYDSLEVSSDLEEDLLASPATGPVSSFLETSPNLQQTESGFPNHDYDTIPGIFAMGGLRNFYTPAEEESKDDAEGSKLAVWKSLIDPPSPLLSDHLPFFALDDVCPPSPPPPTSICPSTIEYPPTPSTFSRQLSEVLTKNRVLTGGCLGLEILPDLTIVRTPVTVCLQPPFCSVREGLALQKPRYDHHDSRPKLEINITHNSLWDDGELSALISRADPGLCSQYQNPWPTPVTQTSSLSSMPSAPSSAPSTFISCGSSPDMYLLFPFADDELDNQEYSNRAACQLSSYKAEPAANDMALDTSSLLTASPIMSRAIGFLKSFVTPIDSTFQDSPTMRIPGTYEPILIS